MKKKNFAILLIIPFLVALFGVVTIRAAFNLIDNDVVRIDWSYRENELFEVGKQIPLAAEGVVADSRYPVSEGNRIVWTVENADGAEEPHAEIYEAGVGKWFLRTRTVGRVTITCSTEKGNVTPRRMTGILYSGNAFAVNTEVDGSGQNVDKTVYYGEYDLENGIKQPAVIRFDLTLSDPSLRSDIKVDEARTTSNLTVDLAGETITVHGAGASTAAFISGRDGLTAEFSFEVVRDGVNVYTYDDLLDCTNRSTSGEIVVLRKNFESKANFEGAASSNVALFGTERGGRFDFSDEVYRFPTTWNSEFIGQWNAFAATHAQYSPVSDEIIAGLRIRKDVYGNGYTLNLHNLCFPTSYSTTTDASGNTFDSYFPGPLDLFRGPKPFYMLGDPNGSKPLVTAFGQDNIGLYVDGSGITIDDIKVKNCDFGLIVQNLHYTGTVLEVHGSDVTVKNSVLSNGKTVMRSYSSKNVRIENCILSTARNFLLMVGSNRYEKNQTDSTKKFSFTNLDGSASSATLAAHLGKDGDGDRSLSLFTTGYPDFNALLGGGAVPYEREAMKTALHSLQRGLNCEDLIDETDIDGTTEICDTIFYRSGIAAIGVETLFNGPFLYNRAPSVLSGVLGLLNIAAEVTPGFGEIEMNLSGASYPVSVNLSGNTRFFDYKTLGSWDISGLIDQNISDVVKSMLDRDYDITIDDIFPLKEILTARARERGVIYDIGGEEYINIPVAFYGGGKNLSSVTVNGLTAGGLTEAVDVDLLDSYLSLTTTLDLSGLANGEGLHSVVSQPNFMRFMKEVLTKTVTTVTGYEPFKFRFGSDPSGVFDVASGTPLVPDYRDLMKAKETV